MIVLVAIDRQIPIWFAISTIARRQLARSCGYSWRLVYLIYRQKIWNLIQIPIPKALEPKNELPRTPESHLKHNVFSHMPASTLCKSPIWSALPVLIDDHRNGPY